jgi:hypothetical protein
MAGRDGDAMIFDRQEAGQALRWSMLAIAIICLFLFAVSLAIV